jgi:hypothetical protein
LLSSSVGLRALLLLAVQGFDCDLTEAGLLAFSSPSAVRLPHADSDPIHQRDHHRRSSRIGNFIPLPRLLELVGGTGRPGRHGFVVHVTSQVHGQSVGRFVTPGAIFLQALHHDPVQVATEHGRELGHFGPAALGCRRPFLAH